MPNDQTSQTYFFHAFFPKKYLPDTIQTHLFLINIKIEKSTLIFYILFFKALHFNKIPKQIFMLFF